MKITTTKFNKENSVKHFKNNIKFLAPLSLVLSLSLSPLSAEEDGGFMTFGYELGQVVQSVKNPNKYKEIELANEINATKTININNEHMGANIVGNLGNLLMVQLQNLGNLYPQPKSDIKQDFANTNGYQLYEAMYQNAQQAIKKLADITQFGNTTQSLLFQQRYSLNNLYSYFDYMNINVIINNMPSGDLKLADSNQAFYATYQSNLTKIATRNFIDALIAMQTFNASNAGNDLSAKAFTNLVQDMIEQSKTTLNDLNKANIGIVTGYQKGWGKQPISTEKYFDNTQATLTKLIQANNQLKANPWLAQFVAGNSKQTNSMSGFYTKIGYKQFFGKKKAFGLRYYGFFSYNGAGVGNGSTHNQVNLLTYGVGTDALYNVFSRSFGSRSIDAGFFTGIQLAGDSYITSLANNPQLIKQPTTTKFQFLFDVGMRMNFGILKKHQKKHEQHSIEIGVQIPTIYNTYYKAGSTEVKYYRPYSVYWVYGYAF
ncbi:outer membrane protein [Helicobacter cetorum]|uniref:Outer membrane protein/porin n=1 Tax=Helicobacter cetorum (strain ATCC BAA-429 / MIT 00-7128) TaxID=182217 RepID=I0ENE3_HELC0|nr:outer membrane protein [Helicobacter cetorum]AFI04462.1 Outer membrane protein/porin [Helicobacter cetorum MIT 00-7128]